VQKQIYPSDLTDNQWEHIKDLFPVHARRRGRPRELDLRLVVNALFYVLRTGCQWRYLPVQYPCWQSVYYYFRVWQKNGTWQRIHDRLRAEVRRKAKRHKHPTAGCLDSQSVKTTATPGIRGFDAGKKVNGRKRHILVDTLGLLLVVVVHTADLSESAGARLVLRKMGGSCKKLRRVWLDGGYRGSVLAWAFDVFRIVLEVVKPPPEQKGFAVLPRRWVVERTFAWLNNHRRLSKDYERETKTSEAFIQIAMMRLMLRRLCPK
jgi:putative transposase